MKNMGKNKEGSNYKKEKTRQEWEEKAVAKNRKQDKNGKRKR